MEQDQRSSEVNCCKLFSYVNVLFFSNDRWFKGSGINLGSEKIMHDVANSLVGENLDAELCPLSFPLTDGEEIRGAPHAFIPDLSQKIVQLLEESHRYIHV